MYDENENALHIEAFVLWGEMALRNIPMAVIDKRLLYYRDNDQSICHTYTSLQLENHKKRVEFMLNTLLGLEGYNHSVNILYDNKNFYSYRKLSNALKLIDIAYKQYIHKFQIPIFEIKDVNEARFAIKRNLIASMVRRYRGCKRIQVACLFLLVMMKIK